MKRSGLENYEKIAREGLAKELLALLKVSSSLASTLELSEVLQIAIESAADLLNLETGAIYTLENGLLYLGATTPPLPPQFPEELRLAHLEDHPHIARVIATRTHIYLDDTTSAELSPAEKIVVEARHLISILYFPLLLKENGIGVFIVGSTKASRPFTQREIDLCHILSNQVSLAISNAQLYLRAQQATIDLGRAYDATLEGWSRMLDLRDHITDAHTHRVVDLTLQLARTLNVPETSMSEIRKGALLHDIGKMGIPDAILQKPGPLSEEERSVMQTHPEKAFKILTQIDHLAPVVSIPFCHHERWDGSGYPSRLKGEEIPIEARIFSIVDVYDALTSDRPYRNAWTKEEAIEYIRSQSGLAFWPEAVEAFLGIISA